MTAYLTQPVLPDLDRSGERPKRCEKRGHRIVVKGYLVDPADARTLATLANHPAHALQAQPAPR